jgi:hypothetical protein
MNRLTLLLALVLATPAIGAKPEPTQALFARRVAVDGGDLDRFVTSVVATSGAQTLTVTGSAPTGEFALRGVTVTLTDADVSGTTSSVLVTGTSQRGATQTETIAVTGPGTFYGTKYFATVTDAVATNAGIDGTDTLQVGQGAQWVGALTRRGCVGWFLGRYAASTDDVIVNLNGQPARTEGNDDADNHDDQLVLSAEFPTRSLEVFAAGFATNGVGLLADVANSGSATVLVEAACYD